MSSLLVGGNLPMHAKIHVGFFSPVLSSTLFFKMFYMLNFIIIVRWWFVSRITPKPRQILMKNFGGIGNN